MEIASTSNNLNMFPTDQRYEIKDVGCKSTSSSFLHINPKLRLDGEERGDVVTATPKKRKHPNEETPREKRQKKTMEALKSKFITKAVEETEKQDHSLKDLIAKAREKVQEKRQIDHMNTCIASQRITARLALNQMVKTVDFDDHLKYHMELEKVGCDFIRGQVSCLNKFDLLSRSDYYTDESNSE